MAKRTAAGRAWVAVAAAGGAAGCVGDGLSPREKPQAYADTIYHGMEPVRLPATLGAPLAVTGTAAVPAAEVRVAPRFAVSGPISVAVVQMGEVAPPEAAIRSFQDRRDLFSKVDPLAGRSSPEGRATDDDVTAYRTAAAKLGDDYVLVYGGTVDHGQVTTALGVFDLTIVGFFVVPSEQVTVTGRAAGSLVEVRTGRLGFGVTADASATTLQPAASAYGVRGPLTDAIRRELAAKLVAQTQDRLAAARSPRT